jgi:hypothetical protein
MCALAHISAGNYSLYFELVEQEIGTAIAHSHTSTDACRVSVNESVA